MKACMEIFRRLFAYLVIIAFSVFVALIASAYFTGQVKLQQDEKIQGSLISEAMRLESQFEVINSMMKLNYQKIRSQNIIKIGREFNNLDRFDIYKAITTLAEANASAIQSRNRRAFDTMLFFTKSDIAISSASMYTIDNLAELFIGAPVEDVRAMFDDIRQSAADNHLVSYHMGNKRTDLYLRLFSIMGSQEKVIGISKLDSSMFNFETVYDGFVYLTTKDGIITNHSFADPVYPLPGFDEVHAMALGMETGSVDTSYHLNWKMVQRGFYLVSLVPTAVYQTALVNTHLLIVFGVVVLSVSACVLIYRTRSRQSRNLLELGKLIKAGQLTEKQPWGKNKHIQEIQEGIMELITQNQSLHQAYAQSALQIEKSSSLMRDSFIRMLVLGTVHRDELDDLMAFYRIKADYGRFRVLLLQIQRLDMLPDDLEQAKRAVSIAAISNIETRFEICGMDDSTVAVLLMYDVSEQDNTEEKIGHQVQRISRILDERFDLQVLAALGTEVDLVSNCHFSYYSARIVLLIGSRMETASNEGQALASEEESVHITRILNAVEKGDTQLCLQAFNLLFQPMDPERNYSVKQQESARMLFFLFDEVINRNDELKKMFMQNEDFKYQLMANHTFDDVLGMMKGMLMFAAEKIALRGENKGQLAVNYAIRVIHENYLDANLSQQDIADQANINVSTLSHQFRESVGITMTAYIRGLRVEKLKQLLLSDTVDSLEEIAERSGFNSLKTMYRVFKAETGLTPSQFRKTLAR